MTQPTWSTACPDWERRILARESLIPFAPLFPAEAEAALDVFRDLQIVDAPGSPTMDEACREWVFDFAGSVFGALDRQANRRLIREFFLLVSKKNSKSTIAAGIMLTALIRNSRRSAEFLILAPTIEVAGNSFKPAADMIRSSPELSAFLHPQDHIRTITHMTTGATLKVVAADNDTVSGKKTTGLLVDELWVFGKRPGAENMIREAKGGLASRPEGFVIYLSTQADDPPAGVFKQKLDYFRDVRDGKIVDNKSLGVLYEFPPAMVAAEQHKDRAHFYVTNPNLGLSVDEDYLESEYALAERGGEGSMRGFLAKHLNVEIGMGLRSNRWPGAEFWERRGDPTLTLEALLDRSECVVVGIDGGGLDDLFGFCALGREKATKRWLAWCHAWCHKGVLVRRKSIATKLEQFKAEGDLTIVDDELADVSGIVSLVVQIKERGLLGGVAVDPAGIDEFVDALAEKEITTESGLLVGAPQGIKMMQHIKGVERKLANGTFVHAGSPMMAWCTTNVRIEPTATAIRATKQTAGDAKIDPWAAVMNAAALMSTNPEPVRPAASPWDDPNFSLVATA